MKTFEQLFKFQIDDYRTGKFSSVGKDSFFISRFITYQSGRPICIGDHIYIGNVYTGPNEQFNRFVLLHRDEYGTIYEEDIRFSKDNKINKHPFIKVKKGIIIEGIRGIIIRE